MTLPRLADLVSDVCKFLFLACLIAQLCSAIGLAPPLAIYVILLLTVFAVSGAIGILQIRVEMIERSWPFFTYESIHTLFRRFPPWAGVVAAAMFGWHVLTVSSQEIDGHGYALLAGVLALEFGAVRSLQRQPWLLEKLTCPDGHPIRYFNRFCPKCGALLPRIPGST